VGNIGKRVGNIDEQLRNSDAYVMGMFRGVRNMVLHVSEALRIDNPERCKNTMESA